MKPSFAPLYYVAFRLPDLPSPGSANDKQAAIEAALQKIDPALVGGQVDAVMADLNGDTRIDVLVLP